MGKPIPMVELWRGGLLESTHLGHAVLVDDTGQIVQAWGDPERIIFPRSSCKMIQALPLVESGGCLWPDPGAIGAVMCQPSGGGAACQRRA